MGITVLVDTKQKAGERTVESVVLTHLPTRVSRAFYKALVGMWRNKDQSWKLRWTLRRGSPYPQDAGGDSPDAGGLTPVTALQGRAEALVRPCSPSCGQRGRTPTGAGSLDHVHQRAQFGSFGSLSDKRIGDSKGVKI